MLAVLRIPSVFEMTYDHFVGTRKGRMKRRKASPAPAEPLEALYGRPEFMIRRAHQIATSVFSASFTPLNLTPSQFSLLFVLRHHGEVGQNELGRLVSLDRSTTALVVRLLKARGLVGVTSDGADRRKTVISITNGGRLLLARAEKLNARASNQLLSVFQPEQARAFLALLETFNASFGAQEEASSESQAAPKRRRVSA